jgi:DeoR/GlpR family transcriptional regulator of sugar metabolism
LANQLTAKRSLLGFDWTSAVYDSDVSATQGRQAEIIRELKQVDRVSVAALAQRLDISEVTVRRDLAELESAGLLRRVHGGAVSAMLRGDELPFAMREIECADEKRRIAAAAVGLISDGEAVVIDSGTTGLAAARELRARRATVMPLSIAAITVLAGAERLSLLLPGGNVRPGEMSVVGPMLQDNLAALRFDTFLMTCCGFDVERGVTAFDLQDAAVKGAAVRASARVVAMLDGSKFGRTTLAVVCEATAVDVVVTDSSAPADAITRLEAIGVLVLHA